MLKANIYNTFHESLPVVFAWSIFDPLKVPNKEHLSFKMHMYGKNQVHPLVKHFMSSMPPDKNSQLEMQLNLSLQSWSMTCSHGRKKFLKNATPLMFPIK